MDVVKEEISLHILCNACLCLGRKLYEISDKTLKQYYLGALNEIPLCNMPAISPMVCLDCRALLKRSYEFREQVKDSYRILMTYTSENLNECLLTDVSRSPRLRIQNNNFIDIEPETYVASVERIPKKHRKRKKIDVDENLSKESQSDLPQTYSPNHTDLPANCRNTQEVYVKEELKIEFYNSDRDDDFDIPLMDLKQVDTLADINTLIQENTISKEIEEVKKNKKELKRSKKVGKIKTKKKIKKDEEKQTDTQNIITVHMTYEEMLLEREKESKRDSYMKAEFKCQTCIVGFNYSKSYKKHLMDRHSPSIGKYTCPICKTVLSSVESFSTHYKRHMKRYECSICQKRTTDVKSMQQHFYSSHDIALKQYKCADCGNISNSVDSHRYHTDSHKSRLQCPDCDKTFRHRGGLLNHKLTVHEARNKFPCPHCSKVFRWKNSLKRHLPVHDEKNKPECEWQCCVCRVSFASLGSYKRHMKNSLRHVTKEHLRFICDHCDRRFADKTKLRDHIEEKHLHKTYQCKVCHKTFMNRVNLDQHMRNVHKGRPNNKMCHHCGKGFPTKAQLESHIRTHTGERPFICEFCPTTFSQHSNLYKHNRQVHLNMKSKRYPVVKKRKEDLDIMTSTDIQIDYPVDIGFTM